MLARRKQGESSVGHVHQQKLKSIKNSLPIFFLVNEEQVYLSQKNKRRSHPLATINSLANHSQGRAGPQDLTVTIGHRNNTSWTLARPVTRTEYIDLYAHVIFQLCTGKISINLLLIGPARETETCQSPVPRAFCPISSCCKGLWDRYKDFAVCGNWCLHCFDTTQYRAKGLCSG